MCVRERKREVDERVAQEQGKDKPPRFWTSGRPHRLHLPVLRGSPLDNLFFFKFEEEKRKLIFVLYDVGGLHEGRD